MKRGQYIPDSLRERIAAKFSVVAYGKGGGVYEPLQWAIRTKVRKGKSGKIIAVFDDQYEAKAALDTFINHVFSKSPGRKKKKLKWPDTRNRRKIKS